MVGFDSLVREIRNLVQDSLFKKEVSRELDELIFEDVWIESDEEWRKLFHDDIPETLKEVFRKIGLFCRIYHKKDDVPGPEYIANCITRSGRKVALGLDVDYDHEVGEVVLTFAQAWSDAEWTPSQLVYYHET